MLVRHPRQCAGKILQAGIWRLGCGKILQRARRDNPLSCRIPVFTKSKRFVSKFRGDTEGLVEGKLGGLMGPTDGNNAENDLDDKKKKVITHRCGFPIGVLF